MKHEMFNKICYPSTQYHHNDITICYNCRLLVIPDRSYEAHYAADQ